MKKILFTLAITTFTFTIGLAQSNSAADKKKIIQEEAGRPDVPGDLFIETGFNMLMDDDDVLNTKLWGSKIFNFYYQYGKNIGSSRFSVHPGIGIGTEKYAFGDSLTLRSRLDQNAVINEMYPVDSIYPNTNVRKNKLAVSYLDIPVELRWRSQKYDPKRSVKVAVGGKVGFRLDAHTKVKYDALGEKKVSKQKEDFDVSKIRYGVYGKVGYGNAYLFYYYSLSQLFDGSSGPQGTEAFPVMFGLSLSVF